MSFKQGCNWFYVFMGIVCITGSLGVGILTFIYNDWVRYYVSDSLPKNTSILYHSRRRGIFSEGLLNLSEKRDGLELDPNGNTLVDLGWKSGGNIPYNYIMNLRRARLGVHAAGFIVMAITLLLFLGSLFQFCATKKHSRNQMVIRMFCGVMCLIGGVCYMISMIIFHILHDEEKVNSVELLPLSYFQWSDEIKRMTTITYGSMYYVNWGACFLALLGALIFLTSNLCCQKTEPCSIYVNHDPNYVNGYPLSQYKTNGMGQANGHHSPGLLRAGGGPHTATTPIGGVSYRSQQDDDRSLRSGVSGAHRLPRYPVDRGHDGPFTGITPDSPPVYPNNSKNFRIY